MLNILVNARLPSIASDTVSISLKYQHCLLPPIQSRPASRSILQSRSAKMACPQCFSGHVNPGTPIGRIEKVYGLQTYISDPPDGKPAKGVIVIIPDAFGLPFVNNQILADHYAASAQCLVYLPDFMDGKSNLQISMATL